MRLVWVVLFLAVLAIGLIHIRRAEVTAQHEFQRLKAEEISLHRKIWIEQVEFSRLTTPAETRRRASGMALRLVDKHHGWMSIARRDDFSVTTESR